MAWIRFPAETEAFLRRRTQTDSRATQPSIQLAPRILLPGDKAPKLTYHILPRLRVRGGHSPLAIYLEVLELERIVC